MKVVICLNGEPLNSYEYDKNARYIACDGGYVFLKDRGITPDYAIGDFDSLGFIPENALVYPCDKDYTDGELGLLKTLDLNPDFIEFICIGGKRDDQFFANVGLLEKALDLGLFAKAVTNAGDIYCVKEKISLKVNVGDVISVYPLEKSVIQSSVGLKYSYEDTPLKRGDTLGISNEAVSDEIKLKVKSGAVLLFVNK